jgi:mannose-6-phosphate isomerase-like protein (cupin superfamily)
MVPLALAIASFVTTKAVGRLDESTGEAQKRGYVIETDSSVAKPQPGPHEGGGETTGYSFFSEVPDLEFVFRKRALHPGAAIGYHEQERDEVYYVLSGTGELTMNGTKSVVGPGTAILTRPGSSHGLRQTGADDLVIFIVYNTSSAR